MNEGDIFQGDTFLTTDEEFEKPILQPEGHPYMNHQLADRIDAKYLLSKRGRFIVIAVTGTGMSRVGKTTLASQIAARLAWRSGRKYDMTSVYFDGGELINDMKRKKHLILQYDEARKELASSKRNTEAAQLLLDIMNLVGINNHILIFVFNNYLELNAAMVSFLSCLVNVYELPNDVFIKEEGFQRVYPLSELGFFEYFERKSAIQLWHNARRLNTKAVDFYGEIGDRTFNGEFSKRLMIDQVEYDKRKMEYVNKFREEDMSAGGIRAFKHTAQRDVLIREVLERKLMSQVEIERLYAKKGIGLTQVAIHTIAAKDKYKYNVFTKNKHLPQGSDENAEKWGVDENG